MTGLRLFRPGRARQDAISALLRKHRAVTAEDCAIAVENLPREPCKHKNVWPSCPKCSRREALKEAARAVRESGGRHG